jgi:two-component system CheB/CheR fusion protein
MIHASDVGHQAEDDSNSSLAYVQSVVDTIREPFLVLDSSLHVISASRSFFDAFKVTAEETVGQFIYDLGDGQWNIPDLRRLLEEVLSQQTAFDDFRVSHEFPSIGRKTMLLNGRKLRGSEDHTEHVLLAIEDISEKQRVLDELIRSNEDLQRFAYAAAHDLRSPLNSGVQLLQMFLWRRRDGLNEVDTRTLDLALASFKRLGELMEDLLTYSAAENAPQQLAPINLQMPLQIALANLQHHIEQSGATVHLGELPTVSTDRTQMVMVFQNLIGNAIKYRREEPLIIRIAAEKRDGAWCVSVTDNGQGFSPEYSRRIFEPFKRLHGAEIPGSGIGLATCQRIITRMGGRIWAESVPGRGSTFSFTIPS